MEWRAKLRRGIGDKRQLDCNEETRGKKGSAVPKDKK
jgi:hypothetical protein